MSSGILEGEDLRFWREFLRWSQTIHASVNRAVAAAAGLSVPEFEVLTRLWTEADQTLPQLDLATELGWSASRTSHLLHRLEGRALIVRQDSGQGRARNVCLTDAGSAHLRKAFDAHGAAFKRELLDSLSTTERGTLLALMTRQREN